MRNKDFAHEKEKEDSQKKIYDNAFLGNEGRG
jgi:hypothetical protein